jgi:hypothetical protein
MERALNPNALDATDLAKILSKASGLTITEAMILADRQAGAPANPDGTVNLIHYTAWLAREADHGQ